MLLRSLGHPTSPPPGQRPVPSPNPRTRDPPSSAGAAEGKNTAGSLRASLQRTLDLPFQTAKLARLRSPLLPLPVPSLALTPPPDFLDHPYQLAPFQFRGIKMEESHALPHPATLEPISRPSSASTTASQKESLPGISAIAAAAAAAATAGASSPQLRYVGPFALGPALAVCWNMTWLLFGFATGFEV